MKTNTRFLPKNGSIRKKSTGRRDVTTTYDTPAFNAISAGMTGEKDLFIIVSTEGDSVASYRKTDDQLAQIIEILGHLSQTTSEGKEINAIRDQVGCPPYTFSYVNTFYPGSEMGLVTGWEEHGMNTLAGQTIMPSVGDDAAERRQAVLYGVGNIQHLESIEAVFLDYFDPLCYSRCFSNDILSSQTEDGLTKYFVQWELLPDEAAAALKPALGETEFNSLMDILVQKTNNYGDADLRHSEQTQLQEPKDWDVFGNV